MGGGRSGGRVRWGRVVGREGKWGEGGRVSGAGW